MSSSAAAAGSSRSGVEPDRLADRQAEHRPEPLAAAVDRVADRLAEPVGAVGLPVLGSAEIGLDELAKLVRRPHRPPAWRALSSASTSFAISAQLASRSIAALRVLGRLELRPHCLELLEQLFGALQ